MPAPVAAPPPDTGVGLVGQFCPDLFETFFELTEFGDSFKFRIVEDGAEKEFVTAVVWDTETLKTRVIVQQQGVFLGTVLCFISMTCFKIEPKPEQIIYRWVAFPNSTQGYWEGWRVVDIVNAECCYELYLDKLIA